MENESTNCHESLQVVADKTRLEILRRLMKSPCHVGELNEGLQIEQSLLSHHLKVLRESGLVRSQRDGKAVLYSLPDEVRIENDGGINLGCCQLNFES